MESDERVELREWNPDWRGTYEGEGIRLLEALGESVRAIEHVGSTAVEGVPARPIVDIMVGVDSLEAATPHVVTLQELGYEYFGEEGLEGRRFFRKRSPDAFNLELLIHRGAPWQQRLTLRAYLGSDAERAREFGRAKRELVEDRGLDRLERYTEAKRPLLDEWTERALEWAEDEPAS